MKKCTKTTNEVLVLLFAAVGFGVFACSSSDSSDPLETTTAVWDHAVDFSAYQTFALVEPPEDEEQPGDITEGVRLALIEALTDELEDVGLTESASIEDADLKVTSFVKVKTVDSTVTGYWYEYYYWGWYWGYDEYWYENDEVQFDMGTLIVDAVDVGDAGDEDDKLVFRGVAIGVVNDSPSEAPARIENAVEDIFEFWPAD